MKIKLILFTAIIGFIAFSCKKLELQPKGILGEPELFGTPDGVRKYFVQLYMHLPIEDFMYFAPSGYMPSNNNQWQAQKNSLGAMCGEFYGNTVAMTGGGFGYWPYSDIRVTNVFINNFPNYKAKYDDATYNSLMGEARFLRAFFYEGLAKRYGGVPIITQVQDPLNGTPEELNVSRNTEYDTWKFIHDDLQFAMDNMSQTSEEGRANKYVAAALMSRSMLYAGRVAKYTQYVGLGSEAAVQGGFAGMDPSSASEFLQYAYDAGKFIEQGPYSLYTTKYPDKANNFASLFLDKSSPENIFTKGYDGQTYGHSYDALMCYAFDYSLSYGILAAPIYNFAKMYEFPVIIDAQGKPVRFNSPSDIHIGMEPRLQGSCYFNGDMLRGIPVSIRRGIYKSFTVTAAAAQLGSNAAPVNATSNRLLGNLGDKYQGFPITGNQGWFSGRGGENNGHTGIFARKYIDESRPTSLVNINKSNQSWITFRLGEIYLNTAEAAYELGKRTEALDYVEKIRVRAGCQLTRPALDQTVSNTYGYPIEATLQYIRDERARELYMENHYWWDLKTWRIADQVLNKWYAHGLICYYVFNEGKYIYIEENNRGNASITAPKSAVYEKIPQSEINKNTNLLPQNPLY